MITHKKEKTEKILTINFTEKYRDDKYLKIFKM